MKRLILGTMCLAAVVIMTAPLSAGNGGHGNHNSRNDFFDFLFGKPDPVVTVAFGSGINTSGAANHHVLPRIINVKKGGVVNFVVGGFHQLFVYVPGVTVAEVLANTPAWGPPAIPVTPSNLYINYGYPLDPVSPKLYYVGINPGIVPTPPGPMAPIPNPAQPLNPPVYSNLFNRVEPVAFNEEGWFLAMCNINPHFRDGMYAWVRVRK